MTYQARVSTSENTGTGPGATNAPMAVCRLTTSASNGARTWQKSRSSSALPRAASAASRLARSASRSPTSFSAWSIFPRASSSPAAAESFAVRAWSILSGVTNSRESSGSRRWRLSVAFLSCASMRCTLALAAATAKRWPSMRRSVTSISPSSAATSARARWSANSYGRGSATGSRSPCFTCWLSLTRSSVIVPLTCGTTPMMSAVTTASSVCGWRTTRSTTTIARITNPVTMPKAISLPTARRRSAILAPEHHQPGGEGQETDEAGIDHGRGSEIRRDVDRDQHLLDHDRQNDADDDRDQPRRKERAEDVDRRGHPTTGDADHDRWGDGNRGDAMHEDTSRRAGCRLEHGIVKTQVPCLKRRVSSTLERAPRRRLWPPNGQSRARDFRGWRGGVTGPQQ